MLRFLFLVVFATAITPILPMGLGIFSSSLHPKGKSLDFEELCHWFCDDHHYDYDYFFRSADDPQARIFCGLCEKKYSTTTSTTEKSTTTTSTKPTTTTSTKAPNTSSTTLSTSTTAVPTTVPPPTTTTPSSTTVEI